MASLQKITPNLWFKGNAEEAVNFYVSVVENSRILKVARYGKNGPLPEGTVLVIDFELAGLRFTAINAGPEFTFNESVSFAIACDDQKEIDTFWEKLQAGGGREQQCGWLKDRYGLSWQVIWSGLGEVMTGPRADDVMGAVLKMKKLEIEMLQQAAEGG